MSQRMGAYIRYGAENPFGGFLARRGDTKTGLGEMPNPARFCHEHGRFSGDGDRRSGAVDRGPLVR